MIPSASVCAGVPDWSVVSCESAEKGFLISAEQESSVVSGVDGWRGLDGWSLASTESSSGQLGRLGSGSSPLCCNDDCLGS